MIRALRSEWLKTVRRPSVWILLAVLVAVIVLLGYLLGWLSTRSLPAGRFAPPITKELLLQAYHPANFHRQVLGISNVLDQLLAVILGALVMGSEYGWGTWKTVLTQGPTRLQSLGGKLIAVAIVLIVYVLASKLPAEIRLVMAAFDGAAISWPDPPTVLRVAGAIWLMFGWGAAVGMVLAFLFRQSALAIGLGLAYILVIEALVFNILRSAHSNVVDTLEKFFPGPDARALVESFGSLLPAPGPPLVSGEQAALVLQLSS